MSVTVVPRRRLENDKASLLTLYHTPENSNVTLEAASKLQFRVEEWQNSATRWKMAAADTTECYQFTQRRTHAMTTGLEALEEQA